MRNSGPNVRFFIRPHRCPAVSVRSGQGPWAGIAIDGSKRPLWGVADAGEDAPDIDNFVNLSEPRGGQVWPTRMLGLSLAETLFGMVDTASDAKRRG